MISRFHIGTKLMFYVSIVLILAMTTVSLIVFYTSKRELLDQLERKLHTINDSRADHIRSYYKNIQSCFGYIKNSEELTNSIKKLASPEDVNQTISTETAEETLKNRLSAINEAYNFYKIMIISTEGSLLFTTDQVHQVDNSEKKVFIEGDLLLKAKTRIVYSDVFQTVVENRKVHTQFILTPLKDDRDYTIAILACEISMDPVFNIVTDTTGLENTGASYLTQRSENNVNFVSPSRNESIMLLKRSVKLNTDQGTAIQKSVSKEMHGFGTGLTDHQGNRVDAAWTFIPEFNWGLVTTVQHKESYAAIDHLRWLVFIVCLFILLFSLFILTLFIRQFIKPFLRIRDNLVSLSDGNFPRDITYDSNDEIKEASTAINSLTNRLRRATEFAEKIGKGNYNIDFHDWGESNDILSKAFLSMRDSLSELDKEQQKRKWTSEGLNQQTEVIRKNSENITQLGKSIIASLVQYLDAQHGGLYAVNYERNDRFEDDHTQINTYYELVATYAYDISYNTNLKFKLGQGVIGQCAMERETVYIQNAPLNFTKITSSLGDAEATHILIVPLKINLEVLGIIELASFYPFEQYKIDFVEKLGESIASAILSVKSVENTNELLRESQRITNELKQKEQELISNQSRIIDELNTYKKENQSLKDENGRLVSQNEELWKRSKQQD